MRPSVTLQHRKEGLPRKKHGPIADPSRLHKHARAHPRMLSRSQAFAAAFSAKKALLNVNATVNAERTFTFIPSMAYGVGSSESRL